MANPAISWHERAASVRFATQAFIGGRSFEATTGATFDSINAATGKVLAKVAAGATQDIDRS